MFLLIKIKCSSFDEIFPIHANLLIIEKNEGILSIWHACVVLYYITYSEFIQILNDSTWLISSDQHKLSDGILICVGSETNRWIAHIAWKRSVTLDSLDCGIGSHSGSSKMHYHLFWEYAEYSKDFSIGVSYLRSRHLCLYVSICVHATIWTQEMVLIDPLNLVASQTSFLLPCSSTKKLD